MKIYILSQLWEYFYILEIIQEVASTQQAIFIKAGSSKRSKPDGELEKKKKKKTLVDYQKITLTYEKELII